MSRPVLTLLLTASLGAVACKKDKPPAPVAAPVADVTPEPPPAEVHPETKSEELRFVESNAALLCWEKQNKKKAGDAQRTVILNDHGFGGKPGAARFLELSIRGERDPDWGRRTGARIQEEVALQCAADAR